MRLNLFRPAAAAALLTLTLISVQSMSGETYTKNYFLYVGNYGKGIYADRFDADTAKLEPIGIAGEITAPSFLASDRDYRYLYAVSEAEHGGGTVGGFAINRETGALTALNSRPSAGTSPCHLAVDHTGKMLMAANYGSGSVPVFPIRSDGKLGEMSDLIH